MTTGTSTDEDEAAVHALIHAFVRAVRLKDVEAMLSYCAPDLVTFDMMPPLRHAGAEAVRAVWDKTLAGFDIPLQLEMQNLNVFIGDKIAFARSVTHFGGDHLSGGKSANWMCMTLGLRKINRDWKIIHQHVSVPFDMDSGQALMDLEP
jgi:ketosteroid isomerase-like protein